MYAFQCERSNGSTLARWTRCEHSRKNPGSDSKSSSTKTSISKNYYPVEEHIEAQKSQTRLKSNKRYNVPRINIAGRLPEYSRNSVVDLQPKKQRKTKNFFSLNAEMIYFDKEPDALIASSSSCSKKTTIRVKRTQVTLYLWIKRKVNFRVTKSSLRVR